MVTERVRESMDRQGQLDRLLETSILVPFDEDGVELSDEFVDEYATHRDAFAKASDLETELSTLLDAEEATWVTETGRGDAELVARYTVLRDRLPDRPREELLSLALLLAQFERGPPRDEGAPSAFVPVYADQLPVLVSLYRRCIVYVWRDDCDPCDLAREELDALFDTQPEDIACFAVYGPEDAELLDAKFDVVGGPTALFMIDGRVDARIQGAAHQETYVQEVTALRELTDAPTGA